MKELLKKGIIVLLLLVFNIAKTQVNIEDCKITLSPEPIENIVLHTDRNIYLSGERIWFKAYCLVNQDTIESDLSKILYVELFNHSKSSIIQQKLKINNGIATGTIEIPKSYKSGNYFLRAYTQFLKNYPPESFFTTLITIINPLEPLHTNDGNIERDQIEIIPENGLLIDGVSTKVAFRIHNILDHSIKNISVIDDQNNILTNLKSSQNGLGVFEIVPEITKSYFLKLMFDDNNSIVKPLPKVQTKGITLKLNLPDKSIKIINKTNNSEQEPNQNYLLSYYSVNNQIFFEAQVKLKNEINEFLIPENILVDQINYISLKNSSGNTILNHAFFQGSTHNISLEIRQQKQYYSQRELVFLKIIPPNFSSRILSNLSVSVVKKGTYTQLPSYIFDDPQLIKSYCRNIDQSSLNEEQRNILAIFYNKLILPELHQQQLRQANPIFYEWLPEIRDVSISGIIYNKLTKLPLSSIPIYLSVIKNNPQVHIIKSQINGEFVFSLNNLEEFQDIFLCPISESKNKLEIKINTDFANEFPYIKNIPLSINPSHNLLLKEMFINQQTNHLFNVATPSKQQPLYQYQMNIKKPQISILLSDFVGLNSLETVFREIIPNCQVHKKDSQYSLSIVDIDNSFSSDNPLILVDNVPVFDVNELFKVPASKIKKIGVNLSSLVLGDNIINGLIMITTNTEDFGGIKMPEGSTFLEYQTISPSFRFDLNKYDNEEKKTNRLADFRTTLYWNPDLNLTGDTSISFYTSDHCSDYDVIVRGVTKDGKKCYGKTTLRVIKAQTLPDKTNKP